MNCVASNLMMMVFLVTSHTNEWILLTKVVTKVSSFRLEPFDCINLCCINPFFWGQCPCMTSLFSFPKKAGKSVCQIDTPLQAFKTLLKKSFRCPPPPQHVHENGFWIPSFNSLFSPKPNFFTSIDLSIFFP